ncbi:polysaccharide export outer membrane protein [Thiohalospira halophila DSM 15071]|uniref:Polysaccharide export outer membrane protein n=1 Tax=Thiohalospira halophila DSM 15071 TaxID=1123397 RepID=A0A1I1NK12_9GAMM|nr:polysaccharide export outer membrane protein [Thiohalospira halophila DSM 15071]
MKEGPGGLLLAVLALLLVVLQGCGGGAVQREGEGAGPVAPDGMEGYRLVESYRIGVDDTLQVSVWRHEDLSVSVPVRPDGRISVPLGGEIEAAGRTPPEVARSIEGALSEFVRDPQVAVIVTELNSHEYLSRVRVTGAVPSPLSIPYRPGMTVLDLVLEAGGVTEFAAPSRSRVYRRTGTKTETMSVRLDRILEDGDLDSNIELRPGDVVTVPERVF